MNRATLLHLLDHATGISEAEVRELEQLATAFPYCQTAHLLLAKAAHDRGSMLAGQRLRRAATYASDRELLRQLIELTPTVPAPAVAEPEAAAAAEPAPAIIATSLAPESQAFADSAFEEPVEEAPMPTAAEEPVAITDGPDEVSPVLVEEVVAEQPAPDDSVAEPAAFEPVELPTADATADETPALVGTAPEAIVAETREENEPVAAEMAENAGLAVAPVSADEAAPLAVTLSADLALLPVSADSSTTVLPAADELPLAAPPIRPPVEAGSSRFEFGLGEAPEPSPVYQLPELPEEPASTAMPPFRADEHLAYALAAGSRFGACLTLRDAELTEDLPGTANWPPDTLLLAHLAAHRPAAPAAPSSLVLIDKFLRSQPRIKSAARPAPTDAPQADLSVRSTSAPPSLASESLAKIMVKQGKTARAIEIYEQLMQRQPEKKAYFAAQIDLLTQQPE
ncbi:hypothetical protein [Hymenobacter sp. CRA2]|uniref:hypothetical protein n=1 Tax=Hymenobacter sp. CRA2 TaxID=1955620 RepID=UPI00098F7336|nr:hypothetical protein [Hymenobacter sp. CRA2]OON69398.1 hypothetical protein B0919_08950 [Hymenobacter sp. CRA2]